MTLSNSVAKVDIDKGLVQPSLFSAQSTVHCQYVVIQQSSVLKQPTGLDCTLKVWLHYWTMRSFVPMLLVAIT